MLQQLFANYELIMNQLGLLNSYRDLQSISEKNYKYILFNTLN